MAAEQGCEGNFIHVGPLAGPFECWVAGPSPKSLSGVAKSGVERFGDHGVEGVGVGNCVCDQNAGRRNAVRSS